MATAPADPARMRGRAGEKATAAVDEKRRRHDDGAARGENRCGHHVIRLAVRDPGNDVGRCRRDKHHRHAVRKAQEQGRADVPLVLVAVLRRVFAELYRPTQDLSIDFHPESKYFVQSIEYRSEIHPWFERVLYDPFVHVLRTAAGWVRRLQGGSVHLYLVYMTVALMVLLTVARWWR